MAYSNLNSTYKPLSPDYEKDLALKVKSGDNRAREELILSNTGLVLKAASHVTKILRILDLPLDTLKDDLLQEGKEALISAADGFDLEKNCKFSTYAYRAIFNRMLQITGDYYGLSKNWWGYIEQKYGKPPSDEKAEAVDKIYHRIHTIPLDKKIFNNGDNGKRLLEDTLADINAENPHDYAIKGQLHEIIMKIVEKLPVNEGIVIKLRFGLDNNEERTLEEVGKEIGVTREGARVIETRAIKRIRKKYPSLIDFIT